MHLALRYVILYVENLERSIIFYRDLPVYQFELNMVHT